MKETHAKKETTRSRTAHPQCKYVKIQRELRSNDIYCKSVER